MLYESRVCQWRRKARIEKSFCGAGRAGASQCAGCDGWTAAPRGNDTFPFTQGGGPDTGEEGDPTAGDMVQPAAGVAPSEVSVRRVGDDLVLRGRTASPTLRIGRMVVAGN